MALSNITLFNNKFVVCIFLADLGRIGFSQSGQVFEL